MNLFPVRKRVVQLCMLLSVCAFIVGACGVQPATVVETVEKTRLESETLAVAGESIVLETAASLPAQRASGGPAADGASPADATYFEAPGVNPAVKSRADALSTFALDVDTAAFSYARRALLADRRLPEPASVRVEEYVNAFRQGYTAPDADEAFAIYVDGSPSPYHSDGMHFMRVGVHGNRVPEDQRPPTALTFVIDVSGSMEQSDRLGLVKQALTMLVERMGPEDTIGIVVYGSDARVALEPTPASDAAAIRTAIHQLQTEGSTNLEDGLRLGYQMADRHFLPGGINRVVLASDGVANVGETRYEHLADAIRAYADGHIQLTTLGFGMGDYNDALMEQLANRGDGNYAYIDTLAEAQELFVDNLMGTLMVIGQDAKIQVAFNPEVVDEYRLIGYENRTLADEAFRDDRVDAGELGAGHTATAVYAITFVPDANGTIATVSLRWQDPASREVTETAATFTTSELSPSFDQAPARHQLAVLVSQFAEILRQSPYAAGVTFGSLQERGDWLAANLEDAEVAELAEMIVRARELH